jgi:hypothetical protein
MLSLLTAFDLTNVSRFTYLSSQADRIQINEINCNSIQNNSYFIQSFPHNPFNGCIPTYGHIFARSNVPVEEDGVFIHDFTDKTLKMTFDIWWKSMHVEIKRTIIWRSSGHSPAWRFFKHCINEQNGIPALYILYAMRFVPIHDNMGLVQWKIAAQQRHT